MKIIILGAGQVGTSLAENLVAEGHDIIIVDNNPELLTDIQDRFDLQTVHGLGSHPNVLEEAGAEGADMLVAVTDNDEVNLVACFVAYSLFNIPNKIARIRSPNYFERKEIFDADHLAIDFFIRPEDLVTEYIQELIAHPGALQVLNFSEGKVKLVAVKPYYGGILLGKTLNQLPEYLPGVPARVAAIFRENKSIPLIGNTEIELGDEVFFITASENAHTIMSALRRVQEPYKRIMIAGAGNIGARLAQALDKQFHVKVIESNREKCERLAETLDNGVVLCGDCADKDLLINENIEDMDVFCALTNDDEVNILSSLQAKSLGANQVMSLITRTAYVDLIEGGPINIAISPQLVTVGRILARMRRGDVVNVHSLRRGAAEAIEAVAHGDKKSSKVIGRSLRQINLPEATTIGAILRENEVIIPHADTKIESEDHVILFVADKRHLRDVEKLFQVSAGFI